MTRYHVIAFAPGSAAAYPRYRAESYYAASKVADNEWSTGAWHVVVIAANDDGQIQLMISGKERDALTVRYTVSELAADLAAQLREEEQCRSRLQVTR